MEKWKQVVGYEGLYEVSDEGRVRSVDKTTRDGRFWAGRMLGKHRAGSGYHRVVLCVNGVSKHLYVHRLVAEAFILNPENKPEVNHKDGDKHNNSVSNLEWVTKSENGIHSFKSLGRKPGKWMLGKASPYRKFTDEQVEMIRTSSRSCYSIAKEYGVSHSVVQNIRNGKTYKVKAVKR